MTRAIVHNMINWVRIKGLPRTTVTCKATHLRYAHVRSCRDRGAEEQQLGEGWGLEEEKHRAVRSLMAYSWPLPLCKGEAHLGIY